MINPVSIRCCLELRLVAARNGAALVFFPELQRWCAKQYLCCVAGLAAEQIQQQERQRTEGVDPKVKIRSTGNLIVFDPNCSLEAKAFFLPNTFLFINIL